MARLKNIPSRLAAAPRRLSEISAVPATERSALRREATPWRRWYDTKEWRQLRWQVLVRDRFTCRWPGCGRIEIDSSKLVADHIEPHRGDRALFFDPANLQCLCKPCHDSRKQAAERRGLF